MQNHSHLLTEAAMTRAMIMMMMMMMTMMMMMMMIVIEAVVAFSLASAPMHAKQTFQDPGQSNS